MSAKPDDQTRLRELLPVLVHRQSLLGAIRGFFLSRGYLEVQTPVRIPAPALEDYIDAEPAGEQFLRTSPELHMKRLLAAGCTRLFQLGPCFRRGEEGRRHLPEFTMLEWYRAPADYRDILADTVGLLCCAAAAVVGGTRLLYGGSEVDVEAPWEELTVDEAFSRHTRTTATQAVEAGEFERLLADSVEPHLGHGRPTVLFDYPLSLGGLARRKAGDPPRAERWELYVAGLELANAYSELTDAEEQRRRFAATAELRRRQGRPVYPMDQRFLDALDSGLPPCGGIALGVDRLLMVLCGAESLSDVVAFPPASQGRA